MWFLGCVILTRCSPWRETDNPSGGRHITRMHSCYYILRLIALFDNRIIIIIELFGILIIFYLYFLIQFVFN